MSSLSKVLSKCVHGYFNKIKLWYKEIFANNDEQWRVLNKTLSLISYWIYKNIVF